MYTCEKNGKTFRVKDKKAAKAYKAAGYTVAEEPTEETAAAEKKTAKSKAKAAETADTAE